MADDKPFRFLDLPPELRNRILRVRLHCIQLPRSRNYFEGTGVCQLSLAKKVSKNTIKQRDVCEVKQRLSSAKSLDRESLTRIPPTLQDETFPEGFQGRQFLKWEQHRGNQDV